MSSTFSERSDEENQRDLERFTPLLYQLKKSGESSSPTHSMKCDIVGQEPGAYPYPSGDKRQSPNKIEEVEDQAFVKPKKTFCFNLKRLL